MKISLRGYAHKLLMSRTFLREDTDTGFDKGAIGWKGCLRSPNVSAGNRENRDFRMELRSMARRFLSRKLRHKQELSYAASVFSTIEINGTFYSLQSPSSFAKWSSATPDDFVFSVKGGAFHNAHEAPRGRKETAGKFPGIRVAATGAEVGANSVAITTRFSIRQKQNRGFFDDFAVRYRISGSSCPRTR